MWWSGKAVFLCALSVNDSVCERPLRVPREQRGPTSATRPGVTQGDGKVQDVRVTVTETSFDPQRLTLRAGVPARVTFTRTSEKTCATTVVFPSLNIRRDLPLNEPVTIEFTPEKAGEIAFACGINMLRGTIVVQ